MTAAAPPPEAVLAQMRDRTGGPRTRYRLLALLVVLSEVIRPGIVSGNWAGVMVRGAIPLAILAVLQFLLVGGAELPGLGRPGAGAQRRGSLGTGLPRGLRG